MRILLIIFLAIFSGIGLGWGTAVLRARSSVWDGNPVYVKHLNAAKGQHKGPAKVVVDAEEYKFGLLDSGHEGTHDFVLTNRGTGPLVLESGATSCKCTVSLLEHEEIPPGESTKVTLKWKPKDVIGPYSQVAIIFTNDLDRPKVALTVSGEIVAAVQAEPPEVVFSDMPLGRKVEADVRLWCNLSGSPLEVLDTKLADQDLAKFFQVDFRKLSREEVGKRKGAKSGVLLHVTAKPGLPQGPFEQTILLRVNQEASPAVAIPIKGKVASEITVAGPGWNPDRGWLTLGTVSRRTGDERRLLLIVRGPAAKDIKFKLGKAVPEFLEVRFGETTLGGGGAVSHTPMFIRVPKGCRPVGYLGPAKEQLGRVVLETNHPQVPQLPILIRFAVEE
jgi:hypothetical protein